MTADRPVRAADTPAVSDARRGADDAARFEPYVPWLARSRQPAAPGHWQVDGTVVYSDISGFTEVAERLATRGRLGAEELVRTVSEVFTALLQETLDGGDVLRLSGDAVVVLYTGPDHTARAARAAWGMRRALRAVGSIPTRGGPVRPRMSTAVHTASFDVFVVGGPHLELVLVGPAATRTVALEATAEADEILLSPEAAAVLDPGWVGEGKGDGRLLSRVDRSRKPAVSSLPQADDLALFVAPPLRGVLGQPERTHEHRVVTVAFADVCGLDDVTAGQGVETAFRRLQQVTTSLQSAAAELGVCLLSADLFAGGVRFMLASGAPLAVEDDAGRMLRVLNRLTERSEGLAVRAGANRGRVLGGEVGAPHRRTYSVMGDTVNVSARLAGAAAWGQVLAHPAVLEAAESRFRFQPLDPITLKGKAEPVPVCSVGPPVGGVRQRRRGRAPFIGRAAELDELRGLARQAADGTGVVIEVTGETGVGKSRLVDEVVTDLRGWRRVTVDCEPFEANRPYATARPLLRAAFGIEADETPYEAGDALGRLVASEAPDLERWLPLVAVPVGVEVPPTTATAELQPRFAEGWLRTVTADLLGRVVREPTVFRIEDAFWMDEASRALLTHAFEDARGRPWLVVSTRRTGTTWPDHWEDGLRAVRLAPLPTSAARALAHAAADAAAVPRQPASAFVERSGGNPLFLLELVQAEASGGFAGLPETIEGIVAARLDQLDPRDLRVLRHLAVLGSRTPEDRALRFLGDVGVEPGPGAWDRLARAMRREPPGWLSFRHDLFRTVAYESLPFATRRDLHARAGQLLLAEADPAESGHAGTLALHFHRAENWALAWQYSVAAGDQARRDYATLAAVEYYRQALEAAGNLPNLDLVGVARVAEALGDAAELTARYDQADEAFRRARRVTADPAAQTRLLRKQGELRERTGRYSDALRWYRRAMVAAEALADAEARALALVEARLAYAGVRYRQGRLRDAARWAHEVEADATAHGLREALGHAYYLLDAVYTDLGRPAPARYRELALPIFEELGDLVRQANVLNNLGIDAYYEGLWDEALDYHRRSREARQRAGDVVGAATADNNVGEILADRGLLDEAVALFREALHAWRRAGYPAGEALAIANLGRAASRLGRHAEALAQLVDAERRLADIGASQLALEMRARRAEALLAAGRCDEALDLVDAVMGGLEQRGTVALHRPLLERVAGLAHAARGDVDRARGHLEDALAAARHSGNRYEEALALAATDQLGLSADGSGDAAQRMLQSLGVTDLR